MLVHLQHMLINSNMNSAMFCSCTAITLQLLGDNNNVEELLQHMLPQHCFCTSTSCLAAFTAAVLRISTVLYLHCMNLALFNGIANLLQIHIPFQQSCNTTAFVLP